MSTDTRAELQAALEQAVASVQDPAQLLAWLREREERREFFSSCSAYPSDAAYGELRRYLNRDFSHDSDLGATVWKWGREVLLSATSRDTLGRRAMIAVGPRIVAPPWLASLVCELDRFDDDWHRHKKRNTRAELIALVERIAAEHAEAAR